MSTLHIADLIGSKVVDADGTRRGSVVDVVVSQDSDLRLLELVIGRQGWIERLNMANVIRSFDSGHHPDRIPWERIGRIESGRITLAPDPTSA